MIIRGGENIYPRAIENAWPLTRSRVSGGSSTNFRSELYLAEKVPWSVTAMSALGQKQTWLVLFNQLIGALLHEQWHVQPEPLRRLKIDVHRKLRR